MRLGFGMRLTPLLDLASFPVTAGSGAFLTSQSYRIYLIHVK
jgi:hypothetical protein